MKCAKQRFINSDLGRYIVNRAEHDREKAISELKTCDPVNSVKIRQLQDDMNIPDKVVAWLSEAIQIGYVKHEELRQAENEALS